MAGFLKYAAETWCVCSFTIILAETFVPIYLPSPPFREELP